MGYFISERGLIREGFFEKGVFEKESEGNEVERHQTFCGYRTLLLLLREEAAEG